MDMNTISRNTFLSLLLAGTIVAFGMAAREDYEISVMETIPDEAYREITAKLGEGCSQGDIVTEYMDNREEYDRWK